MNTRRGGLLVLTAVLARPALLPAQGHPTADSVAASYRALLVEVRDAVDRVSAQSSEFRRDLPTVGGQTVVARAERLVKACRDARVSVRAGRSRLAEANLEARQRADRDSLVVAMDRLTRSLDRDCVRGLPTTGPAGQADSLRAWGPYRTGRLSREINRYHSSAARLARRLGIDLTRQ